MSPPIIHNDYDSADVSRPMKTETVTLLHTVHKIMTSKEKMSSSWTHLLSVVHVTSCQCRKCFDWIVVVGGMQLHTTIKSWLVMCHVPNQNQQTVIVLLPPHAPLVPWQTFDWRRKSKKATPTWRVHVTVSESRYWYHIPVSSNQMLRPEAPRVSLWGFSDINVLHKSRTFALAFILFSWDGGACGGSSVKVPFTVGKMRLQSINQSSLASILMAPLNAPWWFWQAVSPQ